MGSVVLHTRINALKAHINPNLEQENYHPTNKDPSFEEEDGDDDMKLMKSKKDMNFLRNPQKLQRHNKMQHKERKKNFL
jgi:hypothetical protein